MLAAGKDGALDIDEIQKLADRGPCGRAPMPLVSRLRELAAASRNSRCDKRRPPGACCRRPVLAVCPLLDLVTGWSDGFTCRKCRLPPLGPVPTSSFLPCLAAGGHHQVPSLALHGSYRLHGSALNFSSSGAIFSRRQRRRRRRMRRSGEEEVSLVQEARGRTL